MKNLQRTELKISDHYLREEKKAWISPGLINFCSVLNFKQ